MAKKTSAALLLYRIHADSGVLEVLIAHPGGPFWAKKDDGAWSIPKGEYEEDEDPRDAAQREWAEELGMEVPAGEIVELGTVKQPSGKVITTFAVRADVDLANSRSNTFEMEWPRNSGRMQEFPEVDQVGWFSVAVARRKLLKGHLPFLDRLMTSVADGGESVVEGEDRVESEQGTLFG